MTASSYRPYAVRPAAPARRPRATARGILGPGGVIARALPGYESRPSQVELACAIEMLLAQLRNGVMEAGTGTGKSLAALIPAILSGLKVVYSTADKALQAQIVGKDIPFLQDVLEPVLGRRFKAALMKGRANYACKLKVTKLQEAAASTLFEEPVFRSREAATAWAPFQEWYAETESGDLDQITFPLPFDLKGDVTATSDECVGKKCPFYTTCFTESAKLSAEEADVVVTNHSLLMRDLMIRRDSDDMASVIPQARAYLIDECHEIEKIATDALGIEITMGSLMRLLQQVGRFAVKHKAVAEAADEGEITQTATEWEARIMLVFQAWQAMFDELRAGFARDSQVSRLGDEQDMAALPISRLTKLAGAMRAARPSWIEEEEEAMWERLTNRCDALAGEAESVLVPHLSDEGEEIAGLVRFAKLEGREEAQHVMLCAKPIDVAPDMSDLLWNRRYIIRVRDDDGTERVVVDEPVAVIAFSATVAVAGTMEHWRERIGLGRCRELIVRSPFNYRQNALIYCPANGRDFDPSAAHDDEEETIEYLDRVAGEIEQLLLASQGRAFVLFTSYRTMEAIHQRLSPRLSRFLVLKQGDLPRPALVDQFKQNGSAILFGTRSFWTGVDVSGAALSMVIIDKMPFTPPDDLVFEARKAAVNRKYRNPRAWFRKLAIPEAVVALQQGVGRLIRTGTDTGVMVLLDGRLTTRGYGPDILASLPEAPLTTSKEVVRAFFRRCAA